MGLSPRSLGSSSIVIELLKIEQIIFNNLSPKLYAITLCTTSWCSGEWYCQIPNDAIIFLRRGDFSPFQKSLMFSFSVLSLISILAKCIDATSTTNNPTSSDGMSGFDTGTKILVALGSLFCAILTVYAAKIVYKTAKLNSNIPAYTASVLKNHFQLPLPSCWCKTDKSTGLGISKRNLRMKDLELKQMQRQVEESFSNCK
jgi:hypothetical protein